MERLQRWSRRAAAGLAPRLLLAKERGVHGQQLCPLFVCCYYCSPDYYDSVLSQIPKVEEREGHASHAEPHGKLEGQRNLVLLLGETRGGPRLGVRHDRDDLPRLAEPYVWSNSESGVGRILSNCLTFV